MRSTDINGNRCIEAEAYRKHKEKGADDKMQEIH
jgi:hypothetical protein